MSNDRGYLGCLAGVASMFTVLGAIAAVFVVPEVRRGVGLDPPLENRFGPPPVRASAFVPSIETTIRATTTTMAIRPRQTSVAPNANETTPSVQNSATIPPTTSTTTLLKPEVRIDDGITKVRASQAAHGLTARQRQAIVTGDIGLVRSNGIWRIRVSNATLAISTHDIAMTVGANERSFGHPRIGILLSSNESLLPWNGEIPEERRALLVRLSLDRATQESRPIFRSGARGLEPAHLQLVDDATRQRSDPFWWPGGDLALTPQERWVGFFVTQESASWTLRIEQFGVGPPIEFALAEGN